MNLHGWFVNSSGGHVGAMSGVVRKGLPEGIAVGQANRAGPETRGNGCRRIGKKDAVGHIMTAGNPSHGVRAIQASVNAGPSMPAQTAGHGTSVFRTIGTGQTKFLGHGHHPAARAGGSHEPITTASRDGAFNARCYARDGADPSASPPFRMPGQRFPRYQARGCLRRPAGACAGRRRRPSRATISEDS